MRMLMLEVLTGNKPALGLYEGLGFVEFADGAGELPGGFGLPSWLKSSLVLVKELRVT